MSKKDHKCSVCGKPAKNKLHVEPEVGHIYICNATSCRSTALGELMENEYQGRQKSQIEYAEKVGAVSLIIIVSIVVAYIISKFLVRV